MAYECDDPEKTIEILEELQRKGFGDDEFSRLHHFAKRGRRVTISEHVRYCQSTKKFRHGGNNCILQEKLQKRLSGRA